MPSKSKKSGRKTAREKLESKDEVYLTEVKPGKGVRNLSGKMVIPPGKEYDKLMHKIPKGKVITATEIREHFAKKYKADFCCPLVSGIFINLVAQAAEEELENGEKKIDEITPYWRTLKADGELNPKYPGGVEAQAAKLKSEGFKIEPNRNGVPKKVVGYEPKLAKL